MDRGQRPRHARVLQPGKPAFRLRTRRGGMQAQQLHEQQLAQAQPHRAPAGAGGARLRQRQIDQARQRPGPRGARQAEKPRQARQQRIERAFVAAEIAADEARGRRIAAPHAHREGQAPLRQRPEEIQRGVVVELRRRLEPAAHHVGIAMREEDHVARVEAHRRRAGHARPPRVVQRHMIGQDPLRARQHDPSVAARLGQIEPPGRRRIHHEEQRAGEAHRPQRVRQSVPRAFGRGGRNSGVPVIRHARTSP